MGECMNPLGGDRATGGDRRKIEGYKHGHYSIINMSLSGVSDH
jgi:hypothetical protein